MDSTLRGTGLSQTLVQIQFRVPAWTWDWCEASVKHRAKLEPKTGSLFPGGEIVGLVNATIQSLGRGSELRRALTAQMSAGVLERERLSFPFKL